MPVDPAALRRDAGLIEADLEVLARRLATMVHPPLDLQALAMTPLLDEMARSAARLAEISARYRSIRPSSLPRLPGVPDEVFFAEVTLRIARLVPVIDRLRRLGDRPPLPLFRAPEGRDDLANLQAGVTDRTLRRLRAVLNPVAQAPEAAALGAFPDIPMAPSRFVANAHAAHRLAVARSGPGPKSFVDVGCGGGIMLLLAAEIFARCEGLEIDAGYVEAARQMLDVARSDARVLQTDALGWQGYGTRDVIYFFQPMRDETLLLRLERHIVECARPGTLLIAPYDGFHQRAATLGCCYLAGDIHITGATEAEAEVLRDEAQRIGGQLAPHPRRLPGPQDYLRPLIEAGFGVGIDLR